MGGRRLTRRDQAGLPQPLQGKPAGISRRSSRHTCRTRNHSCWRIFLRLPHTSPAIAQRAHFTQSSGIRSRSTSAEGWRWRVHTTSSVRTSTVASQAGRTHNEQHVLRHKCEQTPRSMGFRHFNLVPPTPTIVVHATASIACMLAPFNIHSDLG